MKNLSHLTLCFVLTLSTLLQISSPARAEAVPYDSTALTNLVAQAGREVTDLYGAHRAWLAAQDKRLDELDLIIIRKMHLPGQPSYVEALEEKLRVMETLRLDEENFQLQLLRLRYSKGLEFIKLIYEKVLSLDHHFTSIQTMQQVNSMSNPNSYPAFQQSRIILEERLKKKGGVKLPLVLQNNPFLAATFSIASTLFSEGENSQKEKELEQISCILDFTVRMNADLNTIYYETEFLKQNNQSLKEECLALFGEYTKPIGYYVTLDKCRREDDWDAVKDAIEKIFKEFEASATDPVRSKGSMKQQINLEFSMNRLLDFIEKYSAFINQGEKYYQKFLVIASNYQNASTCAGQLPVQYADLKKDIEIAIEKFGNSYKLTELKGSKLKDLLYGLPENN